MSGLRSHTCLESQLQHSCLDSTAGTVWYSGVRCNSELLVNDGLYGFFKKNMCLTKLHGETGISVGYDVPPPMLGLLRFQEFPRFLDVSELVEKW